MTEINIKQARQALGLTQSQLAADIGWSSPRQIVKLESGALATQQTLMAIECLLWRAGKMPIED